MIYAYGMLNGNYEEAEYKARLLSEKLKEHSKAIESYQEEPNYLPYWLIMGVMFVLLFDVLFSYFLKYF